MTREPDGSQVPPEDHSRPDATPHDPAAPPIKPEDDWQRRLPVRFNLPPGWQMPSQEWVLQHIGLEMSDAWRPPGAPVEDPPGWLWWLPQEPAWSSWIEQLDLARLHVRAATVAFFVFFGIALTAPLTGWVVGTIAITCTISVGIAVLGLRAGLRHFARDPFKDLRRHHEQAVARLRRPYVVGNRTYFVFADFAEGGDL